MKPKEKEWTKAARRNGHPSRHLRLRWFKGSTRSRSSMTRKTKKAAVTKQKQCVPRAHALFETILVNAGTSMSECADDFFLSAWKKRRLCGN